MPSNLTHGWGCMGLMHTTVWIWSRLCTALFSPIPGALSRVGSPVVLCHQKRVHTGGAAGWGGVGVA